MLMVVIWQLSVYKTIFEIKREREEKKKLLFLSMHNRKNSQIGLFISLYHDDAVSS